jgi:hypothetical protein
MLFDGIYKIDRKQARAFLSRYHYLKGCSQGCSPWGQYEAGELVAVACFGVPAIHSARVSILGEPYAKNVFELQRLATSGELKAPLSRFVAQSIREWRRWRERKKQPRPYALLSYADSGEGHHGGIYQALSWGYYGMTKGGDLQYRDNDGGLVRRRVGGVNRKRPDLRPERSTPKYRYVRLFNKKLEVKFARLPYPKPDKMEAFDD